MKTARWNSGEKPQRVFRLSEELANEVARVARDLEFADPHWVVETCVDQMMDLICRPPGARPTPLLARFVDIAREEDARSPFGKLAREIIRDSHRRKFIGRKPLRPAGKEGVGS